MAVSHPIFSRLFARASVAMDQAGMARHRARLVAGLHGRVVDELLAGGVAGLDAVGVGE